MSSAAQDKPSKKSKSPPGPLPLPPPLPGLIDTHCHVDAKYAGRGQPSSDEVLARGRSVGLVGFMVIGVGADASEARGAVALAHAHRDVVAAVGVHPHEAAALTDAIYTEISDLARDPRVAAVGEIGLDYYYDHSPRDVQRDVFRRFIALARALNKPIVIHTRDAGQEPLDILESEGARDVGGVIHCFSEDLAFAKRALDLGFDISFSGIVTFKTATAIQEVARWIPEGRFLVETDAPYLAPEPMRGKLNEPAMVVHTARFLADLRGVAAEEIARASTDNARRRLRGLDAQTP